MSVLDATNSALLIIDVQRKLMPAISGAGRVIANAKRLVGAARALGVLAMATEQYPQGLGGTVDGLLGGDVPVFSKTTFDSTRTPEILQAIPAGKRLIICGCEAHVCVLQTVLGLLANNFQVVVVQDAIGSRVESNRLAACERMAKHGAEIVTTEMVLFEWLGDSSNPAFRSVMKLIK